LLLVAIHFGTALAGNAAPPRTPGHARGQTATTSLATSLADEVSEIANSAMISHSKKERRISTAVRVAVVAATAYRQNPDEILGTALELAAAAGRAAPHFADAISKAVSFAPPVARIEGAAGRIRAATYAAAKAPRVRRERGIAEGDYSEAVAQARRFEPAPAAEPAPRAEPAPVETASESPPAESSDNPNLRPPTRRSRAPRISLGDNAAIHLTTTVGVRRDDNLFLSATDKVGDTIVSVTPGVELGFGQNSLAHGSLVYREAFTRYSGGRAPNVTLGAGNADFGYDDGTLAVTAAGSLQQTFGNNVDVLSLGRRALFRSDVLGLGGSAEWQLGAKLSAKGGLDYSRTSYQSGGLIDNQYFSSPVKVYFKATPKVDLSAGFTYGDVRPQGGGPSGRDLYYNVGARGEFTPKLTGELSVGYRTRTVGDHPVEKTWGLDGAFNYELTPKTNAKLALSRGFSTSALGESLKNGQYTLTLTTDFTPQWQMGANVSYRDVDYGDAIFNVENVILSAHRRDHYWETSLMASYIFSTWLSATADYTFRTDRSTLPGIEFSNNLMSLTLGLRY
jgi:hypothetical protein